MSTLSNVETGRGQATPPSVRVAPETIPEAKSSRTGVSVRYVPAPDKSWYVLRASYGREDKASDYIVEDGTYVYIAKRYARKSVNGKQEVVVHFWRCGLRNRLEGHTERRSCLWTACEWQVVMTITGILLFDVEKCQFFRFNRSFRGDLWHFRVAITQKLGKICE